MNLINDSNSSGASVADKTTPQAGSLTDSPENAGILENRIRMAFNSHCENELRQVALMFKLQGT